MTMARREANNNNGGSGAAALAPSTNTAFANTSFLYGGNAAYVEQLHAAYEQDAGSVDAEWQDFFAGLNDSAADVEKNARGPSWARPNWPIEANGELVSALDGNWANLETALGDKIQGKAEAKGADVSIENVRRATRDSVRALMMIGGYRMRGHLHANLDPLGLEPRPDHIELHPSSYGFEEGDWDRKIFIDHVLGLEFATINEMLALLRRTYCSTIGFEFMHISDPAAKGWIQQRIEGADKEIAFTRECKRAILTKLAEANDFDKFLDVRSTWL